MKLVHEDDDIIVVDKPAGMPSAAVQGSDSPNVFGLLKERLAATGGWRGRGIPRVWILHRLDKEASGLLLFAKTERAFEWLKEEFRSKRVHRLYHGLAVGEMQAGATGTVQSFLRELEDGSVESVPVGQSLIAGVKRERKPRGAKNAGPMADGDAKLAVTHYKVLGVGRGHTLLALRLESGRKHQIRVHMKQLGFPLYGDRKYGGVAAGIDARLALHASELGFTHPTSGQGLRFVSPPAPQFWKIAGLKAPARSEEAELPTPPMKPAPVEQAVSTSWDHVAGWYDDMIDRGRSDHFSRVIIPGAVRLLGDLRGKKVVDVACGQGAFAGELTARGAAVIGVDASAQLIAAARRTARGAGFEVGDARELGSLGLNDVDAVTCIMALMNIDPLEPVFKGVAAMLKPGGVFVSVVLHPAFRAPEQTSWQWEGAAGQAKQFRRVDGYLSHGQTEIVMNPGAVAKGAAKVVTWTFHRPLQTYARYLLQSGFVIEGLEEWPSLRRSEPGPRAAEENRARREIPMFLAWRAVKRG
jgi:23S rRNA-/tRNA-specific pseudouridylate synthase/ubiquinone/menaquinone biosynthesis C-methylase UbiE